MVVDAKGWQKVSTTAVTSRSTTDKDNLLGYHAEGWPQEMAMVWPTAPQGQLRADPPRDHTCSMSSRCAALVRTRRAAALVVSTATSSAGRSSRRAANNFSEAAVISAKTSAMSGQNLENFSQAEPTLLPGAMQVAKPTYPCCAKIFPLCRPLLPFGPVNRSRCIPHWLPIQSCHSIDMPGHAFGRASLL